MWLLNSESQWKHKSISPLRLVITVDSQIIIVYHVSIQHLDRRFMYRQIWIYRSTSTTIFGREIGYDILWLGFVEPLLPIVDYE